MGVGNGQVVILRGDQDVLKFTASEEVSKRPSLRRIVRIAESPRRTDHDDGRLMRAWRPADRVDQTLLGLAGAHQHKPL